MGQVVCRIKSYIQPFERALALQELEALIEGPIVPLNGNLKTATTFTIDETNNVSKLQASLAYWHSVGDEQQGLTTQIQREATYQIARLSSPNLVNSNDIDSLIPRSVPNNRRLRYATHGIHEYRGKFFPQLVRSLMNISKLSSQAVVLDPMCGSGTTLVEARLGGYQGYGLDMNPLSVFLSQVKCNALGLDSSALLKAYDRLKERVGAPVQSQQLGRFASLSHHDQEYLSRWLSQGAITELDHIHASISALPAQLQDFYRVALSNIIRKASWQKNDDLRVRKERQSLESGAVVRIFLEAASRATRVLGAFLAMHEPRIMGSYEVHEADARYTATVLPNLLNQVDAVITSPPYATALPYIDTDRLSLIYLGLLPREEHRARDSVMIGNREIAPRTRSEYWQFYNEHACLLPVNTQGLINHINTLNQDESAGFRRKNLSALLSRYFFDMRTVMQQTFEVLRPGGSLFIVIGNNRTMAGQQQIEIKTSEHLRQIAIGLGYKWLSEIPMDMLVSRDIFRRNAVPSEVILRVEKP